MIPWHYFQLNSRYFNAKKGIFSKLDIDKCIPQKYRLHQYVYTSKRIPSTFPVFLKPEWGQNSNGIYRVAHQEEYIEFEKVTKKVDIPYIVQETAQGDKEFEIYYLRSPKQRKSYAFLSVTQVENQGNDTHPINSIYNPSTAYRDITNIFSNKDLQQIWQIVGAIGNFRMARVGVKADSIDSLLQGKFKIIEINLFLPLPLILLSYNVQRLEKFRIIGKTMTLAAQLVATLSREETRQWIFFRKMRAHYKIAS